MQETELFKTQGYIIVAADGVVQLWDQVTTDAEPDRKVIRKRAMPPGEARDLAQDLCVAAQVVEDLAAYDSI